VEVQFDLRHSQSHGCEISEYARTESADLVVIGTRGKSSLKYLLLGSTAEYVLRERPCSVLAVRPGK
jgi:nucleotide-binding universal stress UspA family protein